MDFTSSYSKFVDGVEFRLVTETRCHIGVSRDGHVLTPRHQDGSYRGSARGNGYLGVTFDDHTLYVHQMVYDLWVEPCPEGMEIDHINTDKRDNRADNLRAVTRSGNMRNPITRKTNLAQLSTVRNRAAEARRSAVEAYTDDGLLAATFSNVTDAAVWAGTARSCIAKVIDGKRKHAGGFTWRRVSK